MTLTGEPSMSAAADNKNTMDVIATIIGGDIDLLDCIGEGGMGSVYKGFHRALQIPVAVKVVNNPNQLALRRLQKEAQSLGSLAHPNIIKVLKFQTLDDSSCALIMEYCPGVDLSREIAMGPMSPDSCLKIFRQICAALEHAHSHNIVHRDVKPSNILLYTEPDGSTTAKLVDFGIASNLGVTGSDQKLTSTGAMIGSPSYMSPEQCSGAPVDARADIYALGCVLYECLSGKRPYEGDSSLEVMYKHLNEQVQCPANLSEASFAVIQRAMLHRPEERYQSVTEFLTALETAVAQGNTKRRPVRKLHRAIIPGMVGLGLSLVAVFCAMLMSIRMPTAEVSTDTMRFDDAVGYLEQHYLSNGEQPPPNVIDAMQERSRTVSNADHLSAFADVCVRALRMFPDRRKLFDPAARHAYDRAIKALHDQGRPAQFEQAKLCVLLLSSPDKYIRQRAIHCVDEELKWAKSVDNDVAARRACVDKLAFFLISGDKPKYLAYRDTLTTNGLPLSEISKIARDSKCENAILLRAYSISPEFPDEPAK